MEPWRRFDSDASGTAATGYLLVGEAPGYRSWANKRRFTGPAGQLIRRALARLAHPRYRDLEDLFFMTDVVKCHPQSSRNPLANRSPRRAEIKACASFLEAELRLLTPSVVVTFGKLAAGSVAQAVSSMAVGTGPVCRIVSFPHPSPRNQRTILRTYPSMDAFERAVMRTFRTLIAAIEKGRRDA